VLGVLSSLLISDAISSVIGYIALIASFFTASFALITSVKSGSIPAASDIGRDIKHIFRDIHEFFRPDGNRNQPLNFSDFAVAEWLVICFTALLTWVFHLIQADWWKSMAFGTGMLLVAVMMLMQFAAVRKEARQDI
jgi:hypothetical protein